MQGSVVIMGVAGCGKSSLAAAVAAGEGMAVIEGDDHHSPGSREKMRLGIALTDADRAGWLASLANVLRAHPHDRVLTCSALRRSYRDLLREAAPGLRFVFLDISREAAGARIAARADHFFSPRLVDSQFATLESPVGEPGVLRVDASDPLPLLQAQVSNWLHSQEAA
ncbi:MAG: gluconokinase, GntK/IdnK-type [Rubrivivax sp.]|nr:gluconokinase, GntK/IdnK-type [Rubrivivax sp.]